MQRIRNNWHIWHALVLWVLAVGLLPEVAHPPARLPAAPAVQHTAHRLPPPRAAIDPYVRPLLADELADLQPTLLAVAARYHDADLCGMDRQSFARLLAVILYNEHNGWLEDAVEPLRLLTPSYERAQVLVNQSGVGSDFSLWPANLRPSVALELVRGEVPIPAAPGVITTPLRVAGSQINPAHYSRMATLYAALSREIQQPELAVEYLAANLVRGCYRARYEGVPANWRVLAAWHNQGIVRPEQIASNGWARDYVRRASAYIPRAQCLVVQGSAPPAQARERTCSP